MKLFNLSALSLAAASALFTGSSVASEQPLAKDLVGNFYGGGHLMHIKTDNERLMTDNPYSDIDHGSGFGVELGYRWTEELELRLSHSRINLVKQYDGGFTEPDGSSTAFDVLYFLNKESFYLMSGLNSLDMVDRKTSVDLGAGYRYHLNERAAVYLEGKTHYQFSEHFTDYTAQLGFIYFFGDNKKSAPAAKTPTAIVADKVAVQALDTDKDGVLDSQDRCANTPALDQVDSQGCTIFTEEKATMQLLVNFDNNKAVVKPEYFNEIQAMANFMRTYPHTTITVEGHTSAQGSAEHNKKLSQARAQAIATMLIKKHGIKANRVSAIGFGEERLLNKADTATAHQENRRITATVETSKKVAKKH